MNIPLLMGVVLGVLSLSCLITYCVIQIRSVGNMFSAFEGFGWIIASVLLMFLSLPLIAWGASDRMHNVGPQIKIVVQP